MTHPHPRSTRLAPPVVCLLVLARASWAQPGTEPTVRPIRQAPGVVLPTPVPVSLPVVPGSPAASGAIPGLGGADVIVPPGQLVREGSFLVRRTGVVLTAPTGERIVVFAASATGRDLPPMVLLPSPMLESIEDAADASRDHQIRLSVTGQVLVYHSRNYLIPTLVTPLADEPAPAIADDAAPTSPQPGRPASPADDQRVLDLIGQLERDARANAARPQPPRAIPASPSTADTDIEPTRSVVYERALVRQRGRLVRSPGGPWVFTVDSDPNSPAPPPMAVMPSLALERIERLAARAGEPLLIELSGRIMAYRGGAFVRPTMIVLHRSFELESGQ